MALTEEEREIVATLNKRIRAQGLSPDAIANLKKSDIESLFVEWELREEQKQNDPQRERLGRAVRREWLKIKNEEDAAGLKVFYSDLLDWEHLDMKNKEIDRRLGDAVLAEIKIPFDTQVTELKNIILELQGLLATAPLSHYSTHWENHRTQTNNKVKTLLQQNTED